jgi:hypothetical protein
VPEPGHLAAPRASLTFAQGDNYFAHSDATDRTGCRTRDASPIRLSSVPHLIGVPAIADDEPPPAWQSGRYQADADAWQQLRPQLRPGQELAGTVAWMIRPGVTGIGVDLGLPVAGFVDFDHMPRDPGRWPALGTFTTFIIWWMDERPQIRLVPADPRYRREDFGTWIQQQATPAAVAFREQTPSGPGGTEASLEHPWLGTVRRHGDGQLIAHISIPPAIRPARASGDDDASAEVLIEGASATAELPALADDAASRVQAALAALDEIKDYAAEHAPSLLAPVPASLRDALFLEGFTISGTGTEIAFDYGALDMIVVQADPGGQCHSVVLCP